MANLMETVTGTPNKERATTPFKKVVAPISSFTNVNPNPAYQTGKHETAKSVQTRGSLLCLTM